MVDLERQEVVYVNAVAQQMAPGVALPVAVSAWSGAAVLRDVDGVELSETDHPLVKVARSEPVAGQAVSAARATEMGPRREPLWVVALPMGDAPQLQGHALVVFLPLADREAAQAAATAAAGQARLRDAAVVATGLSFTVADARAADAPLVWVNPAFTIATGYSFEEAVGRNCRFLQGPDTDPATVTELREALVAGREVSVTLLNHRKDGTAFWNQLAISPIYGLEGELTHFVGIQSDVTARVEADAERDRALALAQQARAEAEATHARLSLLATVTEVLGAGLERDEDAEDAVAHLAQLLVPALGDWCVVSLVEDERSARGAGAGAVRVGEMRDVSSWHVDPDRRELVAAHAGTRWQQPGTSAPLREAVRTGRPVLLGTAGSAEHAGAAAPAPTTKGLAQRGSVPERLAAVSGAVIPLRGRGRTIGLISLFHGAERGPMTAEEVADVEEVAARAGLVLDSARLYRQQRDIAEGLQRSLLTEPPSPDHVQVAVRYTPAAQAAQVGGDWYDAFVQPGGAMDLVIGDVVGHDTQAAAAMGQLRTVVRTTAVVTGAGPARVLEQVDRALEALALATTATAVFARLEQTPEEVQRGVARLSWSNAGHPPPMVVGADGRVRVLEGPETDLLLGVRPQTERGEAQVELEPGASVLLYTDGLVERRDQGLDEGLRRLQGALAALAARDTDLDHLVDGVLEAMLPPRPEDDVALIAVRIRA